MNLLPERVLPPQEAGPVSRAVPPGGRTTPGRRPRPGGPFRRGQQPGPAHGPKQGKGLESGQGLGRPTPGPQIRPGAPVEGTPPIYSLVDRASQIPLSYRVAENLQRIKVILGNSADLVTRTLHVPALSGRLVGLSWLEGLVDGVRQSEYIVASLQKGKSLQEGPARNLPEQGSAPREVQGIGETSHVVTPPRPRESERLVDFLRQHLLAASDVSLGRTWEDVLKAVLNGRTALFVDGAKQALLVDTREVPARSVTEPEVESVIRGPRDGFTEDLHINTALLRLHLQSPALRFEEIRLGRQSQVPCNIAYVAGIAHPQLVQEVRSRLSRVASRYSFNLGEGALEQLIEDHPFSLFPTIHHSERPDKIVAQLVEGRVAIIVQGTPVVLTVPTLFWEFIQSPEDYYERPYLASFVRMLRFAMLAISLTLPSLYVALVSFHHEMVPPSLALRIAGGREAVPFPAVFEALLMEFSFEVLREAGLRLPRPLGQTISIVGVLVIGQAAVSAGIVSPVMVVVVALTAIASFTTPSYSVAISLRLLRFPMIMVAGTAGLYGIAWFTLVISLHLAALRSFGVPFLSPVVPFFGEDWKDVFVRAPWWAMRRRPHLYTRGSRQATAGLVPQPPLLAERARRGNREKE